MRALTLEQKTGFSTILPFVIKEANGNIFYDSSFTDHIKNGKRLFFNLPAGKYQYDGNFIKLQKPVETKRINLPKPERHYKQKRYNIQWGSNPNKCTIFYSTGVVLFDAIFKNAPLYTKYTIMFHELGHHYYETEKFADLYAAKKLLELGFNPSQIRRSIAISLRQAGSENRKEFMYEQLTNSEK
jgi:hypothetical protein